MGKVGAGSRGCKPRTANDQATDALEAAPSALLITATGRKQLGEEIFEFDRSMLAINRVL